MFPPTRGRPSAEGAGGLPRGHPDFDLCIFCGDERYLHNVDPWPFDHDFEPAYLTEWLGAA